VGWCWKKPQGKSPWQVEHWSFGRKEEARGYLGFTEKPSGLASNEPGRKGEERV